MNCRRRPKVMDGQMNQVSLPDEDIEMANVSHLRPGPSQVNHSRPSFPLPPSKRVKATPYSSKFHVSLEDVLDSSTEVSNEINYDARFVVKSTDLNPSLASHSVPRPSAFSV